jgi:hypothetical protein
MIFKTNITKAAGDASLCSEKGVCTRERVANRALKEGKEDKSQVRRCAACQMLGLLLLYKLILAVGIQPGIKQLFSNK